MQELNVPPERHRALNHADVRSDADYVLYWMIANRRPHYNFALQRALQLAAQHGKPVLVLEAVRCDYPWASARLHHVLLDGMRDNQRAFREHGVAYYPYVEPSRGAGRGLLETLATRAVAVVTDDFPCFFLPQMTAAVAKRLDRRLESVDSNGLYPMRATDREFKRAHSFRRHLQKELLPHLAESPLPEPLVHGKSTGKARIPQAVRARWPKASLGRKVQPLLAGLPFPAEVPQVAEFRGGFSAARTQLANFLEHRLEHYESRSDPHESVSSGLSPYLHFGHLSTHEVFAALGDQERWSPAALRRDGEQVKATGKAHGFWGMSSPAETYFDQFVTWRELGYNLCALRADYDQYASLPDWARTTLAEHASDPREYCYDLETFEAAATHDPLWNAAQRQLLREGHIHNYLRMLWGKKILEWSGTPEEALAIMIELNNKYALDGRNPNSYSGIFWILGRYDRAWGPERPVFGKVRYMSSANTARKFRVTEYLCKYGDEA